MKRTVWLFIGIVSWLSITGYDIEMDMRATLYANYENVPFESMKVSGYVQRGERVKVLGCFDNKTNLLFYIANQDGISAYLYDLEFKAIKTWIPTHEKLRFFFNDPLASLQCLVMVPELSQ